MRGRVAIIGAADTEVGAVARMSATQLCVDAACRAMADAGIGKDQIDGLLTCNAMAEPFMYHAEMVAEYLQIFPRYCLSIGAGGASSFALVHHAASAIAAGLCQTVLIAMADTLRTGLSKEQAFGLMSSAGHPQFESPYGPTVPSLYALIARAHMARFGTTAEQLAAIAVNARAYATCNPAAQKRDAITIDDVLASRMVADPLHVLDCSLVSDGGAAVIVTSAQRAKDFRKTPAYLLGAGEGHSHEHISQARDLTTSAAVQSGERAYAMAGLGPVDVDVAELYDCFTPVVLIELEDLGFCRKGEAGAFVLDGQLGPNGKLPTNTHGGLLSHCHPGNPGSMFALTESVRQIRGESTSQVAGAEVVLAHAQGGIMSSHTTLILGAASTL
jgi:acetyl-CoA acetyltransferase